MYFNLDPRIPLQFAIPFSKSVFLSFSTGNRIELSLELNGLDGSFNVIKSPEVGSAATMNHD